MVAAATTWDYMFKVMLLGEPGVGKQSLLYRFADSTCALPLGMALAGVDFQIQTIDVEGTRVKLQAWLQPSLGRWGNR